MRKFGWRKQLPDYRDKHFLSLSLDLAQSVPDVWDAREMCPPVYDQGQLGSCTANAIAFVCEFDLVRQSQKDWTPSRLFIYYNERLMEGTVHSDAGAIIRDGIKSLHKFGFAHEDLWVYDEHKFAIKPPDNVYHAALKQKISIKCYGSVHQNLQEMKLALASNFPIVIGFSVFESFMSSEVAKTGIVAMPSHGESMIGGHAVAIVGYTKDHFIVRNSWGDRWGQKGYFLMPFEYFLNPDLASDLWIVKSVMA